MKTNNEKKGDIIAFLENNFVMDLATSHDDQPAVAPVVYVVDDDLNFYFVTYRVTSKAQNLLKNPHCSWVVWQHLEMSVQASGEASVVEAEEKKEWVMDAFAEAATEDPNFWAPIFRIKRGDYVLFKLTPKWMRSLDLSHSTVRAKESPFTDVEL